MEEDHTVLEALSVEQTIKEPSVLPPTSSPLSFNVEEEFYISNFMFEDEGNHGSVSLKASNRAHNCSADQIFKAKVISLSAIILDSMPNGMPKAAGPFKLVGTLHAKADGADIVELRIDHLHNFNPNTHLHSLLKQRPLPIIITYRPKWEGGEYEGEEVARLDTLRLALELGADFVDVELQHGCDKLTDKYIQVARFGGCKELRAWKVLLYSVGSDCWREFRLLQDAPSLGNEGNNFLGTSISEFSFARNVQSL
ncbi:hypothetical protein KI387_017266 [Taxus chinensis]|uniref:Uncharacterized protein n=1 Tax=Taxus chinensis TaxID=29808 RepID=A0AA38LIX1_TAXCH|nr:hypothetical protein KI387_017266 [Taxus chinensis]